MKIFLLYFGSHFHCQIITSSAFVMSPRQHSVLLGGTMDALALLIENSW